ncbi:MAG: Lipoyl synthase [Acidimicrobiales bacterium]|nr:Lipoyl synthase [Acidimicrobiales bacterium]
MLRVRWLGRVAYRDAWALQRGLFNNSPDDHLLLLEHPHVYTLGARADTSHVLVPPASVGAELVHADRGGDVTYHGPGQLVGYPILDVPSKGRGGKADTVSYVNAVEQLVIDALITLGVRDVGRLAGYPGVWVAPASDSPRKIAAVGVRLDRGRSMHGFALNVDPDLGYFDHIVPCGITDKAVTSMAAEGQRAEMEAVVDAVVERAVGMWGRSGWERADVAWRHRDRDLAPFSRGASDEVAYGERKPDWMRVKVRTGADYLRLKRSMRDLNLRTVCEEAGCPNIFECWNDGTATFMINGERCTRACGFCLVDTRRPEAPDADEPRRVAEAVETMRLDYAVITAVARDDLPDGGAGGFADTVRAIRAKGRGTRVEVLIPDCKGDPESLQVIFDARPDVLNHNVETVPRLQRRARPSAGYARSLGVLAAAKAEGLVTKSGMVLGLGETAFEIEQTLADLRSVGVDIVTLGQYLRPTSGHLPISRWWSPEDFEEFSRLGLALGIAHVEASPLTRSSHHARQASEASSVVGIGPGAVSAG